MQALQIFDARNETLRALFDRANKFGGMQQSMFRPHPVQFTGSNASKLQNPDVARFKAQILKCCAVQRPGVELYSQTAQLLADLRSWLAATSFEGAEVVLLYGAGEALARTEHMARSAGQVQYWPAQAVQLLVSLVQTYSALMDRATAAKPAGTPRTPSRDAKPDALVHTLLQLLVRPDFLDLLIEVLEHVHLSMAFRADCQRHEVVSAAVVLWGFLRDLVRLVGMHSAVLGEKRLAKCMQQLSSLLTPQSGVVPRLLLEPLSAETLAVQLHVLQLLQRLFDAPRPLLEQLLQPEAVASSQLQQQQHGSMASAMVDPGTFYIAHHFREAARCYYASDGNPASASAELCLMHMRLLHGLVRSRAPALVQPAHRLRVVDLLLSELAFEVEAAQAVDAAEAEAGSSNEYTGHLSGSSCVPSSLMETGESVDPDKPGQKQTGGAAVTASTARSHTGKFEFCYDLNEDLERIMELEDQLGSSVEVDGFEYDDEAKQLLQRGEALAAAAAARVNEASPPSAQAQLHEQALHSSNGTAGVPLSIPRLSFSNISRSALSSRSMALASGGRALASSTHAHESQPADIPQETLTPHSTGRASTRSAWSGCGSSPHHPHRISEDPADDQQRLHLRHTHRSPLGDPVSSPVGQALAAGCMPARHSPSRFGSMVIKGVEGAAQCTGRSHVSDKHSSLVVRFQASDQQQLDPRCSEGQAEGSSDPESGAAVHAGQASGPAAGSRCAGVPEHGQPTAGSDLLRKLPMVPVLDFSGIGTASKSARAGGTGRTTQRSSLQLSNKVHIPDSAMDARWSQGKQPVAIDAGNSCLPLFQGKQQTLGGQVQGQGSAVTAPVALHGAKSPSAVYEEQHVGMVMAPQGIGILQGIKQHLLFRDAKLHVLLLRLVLDLAVTEQGTLDPACWQQYPLDNGLPYNLEYLLMWHFNSGAGAGAVQGLRQKLESKGRSGSVPRAAAHMRLLRLLSRGLFIEERYTELKFHARGAVGNIYRAKMVMETAASQPQQVMIKTVELPPSCYDRCVLPDIYGEILILERYKGVQGICQVLDYGLAADAYWIVMRRYRCSLAEWRQRQSLGPASGAALSLYLSVLLQVVASLQILARDSVVHFDLKCSNVLIDPLPGIKDSELWNPLGNSAALTSLAPVSPAAADRAAAHAYSAAAAGQQAGPPAVPFQAVLADFGEARSYSSAEEAFTARNRGTEVYKSPEMLLLNMRPGALSGVGALPADVGKAVEAGRPTSPAEAAAAATKAALSGAGLASDVWSLGCLAYELLSGKVLFGGDYASVTHRVAFGGCENLMLNSAERAALGDRSEVIGLLEWVLARDPLKRPSLAEIEARVRAVQASLHTTAK